MSNPPRVCYDLNHLHKVLLGNERHTGISRVIIEMAKELSRLSARGELDLSFGMSLYPQLTNTLKDYVVTKGCNVKFIEPRGIAAIIYDLMVNYKAHPYNGSFLGKVTPSLYRERDNVDIYHSPFSAIRVPKRTKAVLATTVYDIIPFTHPHFVNPARINNSQSNLRKVAAISDHFFFISKFAQLEWCDFFNVPESRTTVVPLAASKDVFFPESSSDRIKAVSDRYNIPSGRYILTLANLEPRKNINGVIKAFFTLLEEEKLKDVNLVVAGKSGYLLEQVLDSYDKEARYQDRVIFTGGIEESDMSAIYSGAEIFAFLSYCEGFGLPPLEAMQCGVPVVCSNSTSLPEVCGDAALMVNPDDQDQICQYFCDLLGSSALRSDLRTRGLQKSCEFSWESSARATLDAYQILVA